MISAEIVKNPLFCETSGDSLPCREMSEAQRGWHPLDAPSPTDGYFAYYKHRLCSPANNDVYQQSHGRDFSLPYFFIHFTIASVTFISVRPVL